MTDDLDEQLGLTAEQVRQRLTMGDRVDVPRKVDHSATFRTKVAADEAAAALRTLGYQVDLHRRWLKILRESTHFTAVDQSTASSFTREVVGIIEQHGGDYEGWGAMVEE